MENKIKIIYSFSKFYMGETRKFIIKYCDRRFEIDIEGYPTIKLPEIKQVKKPDNEVKVFTLKNISNNLDIYFDDKNYFKIMISEIEKAINNLKL